MAVFSVVMLLSQAVGASAAGNEGSKRYDAEFQQLRDNVKNEAKSKIAPGLYNKRLDIDTKLASNSYKKLGKFLEEHPEYLSESEAFKTFADDSKFNKVFSDVELTAGVGEEKVASYVFEDGSVIEASIKTEAVEPAQEGISILATSTNPDGSGGYNSVYSVKITWSTVTANTSTLANWTNNMSTARVNDHQALADCVGGSCSPSSAISKNNANPSVVRGVFQITDFFNTTSVTKITELYLYPGTTPLAGGAVVR